MNLDNETDNFARNRVNGMKQIRTQKHTRAQECTGVSCTDQITVESVAETQKAALLERNSQPNKALWHNGIT